MAAMRARFPRQYAVPPTISEVVITDELLGFQLEDGRFISVPIGFYPTLALATPEERGRFEVKWLIGLLAGVGCRYRRRGLLAGAQEHSYYARKAVERAVSQGRLPKTALEETPLRGPKRLERWYASKRWPNRFVFPPGRMTRIPL